VDDWTNRHKERQTGSGQTPQERNLTKKAASPPHMDGSIVLARVRPI